MWQVCIKIHDGYEQWEQELPDEIFEIEKMAYDRVDELDRNWTWNQDYHFVKEI